MIGAMNRFVIYGFAALLFLFGMVALFDKEQINALRQMAGFDALYDSEIEDLGADNLAAEFEWIAAAPIPGVLDEPPSLGEAADATLACLEEVGVARLPQARARRALRRYLLVLAASGLERGHPLVEPRLAGLHALTGQGPMAALESAEKDELDPEIRSLLRQFHEIYSDPDHPIYGGIGIYAGTFDGLDFQKAADALAERWPAVAACAREAALPPLTEWQRLAVD